MKRRHPKREKLAVPVAHMVVDKLCRLPLRGSELRVLLWYVRHTWGHFRDGGRPEGSRASRAEVAAGTALTKRAVILALGRLRAAGILVEKDEGLGIDEHFDSDKASDVLASAHRGRDRGGVNSCSPGGCTAVHQGGEQLFTKGVNSCSPPVPVNGRGNDGCETHYQVSGNQVSGNAPDGAPVSLSDILSDTARTMETRAKTTTRKRDPWRRVPEHQRPDLQCAATAAIDRLKKHGFADAGRWWGQGLKRGRWAPAMVHALQRLEDEIRKRRKPDNPWAWLEEVCREEATTIGAGMVEAASAEEKRRNGRPDAGLSTSDPLDRIADRGRARRGARTG